MIYTVTKIESNPRSFRKALNQGLRSNVNEIVIYMEKKSDMFYPLNFWPFNWIVKYKAEGIVNEDININDYLKVGDKFDASQYPMLKISKI